MTSPVTLSDPHDEDVGFAAAIALRVRSTLWRVLAMGVMAALLATVAHWSWAALWWTVHAALQLALVAAARGGSARRREGLLYLISFVTFAVAGAPAWWLWTEVGDIGIAAATLFLCGMMLQLIVASLGARKLFWVSASPLVAYLLVVPPLAFGPDRLTDAAAAMACCLLFVGYMAVQWRGQQAALANIEASRRRAEAANQAKTDFLAIMSHEVRTPMNAVLGAAELLRRGALSAEQRAYVEMVSDAGGVLMHVLNDVLDLSKIEAGKLSIDPVRVDLPALVHRCVRLWEPRARDKGLDFDVALAPSTPQFVVVDAVRIGQILFNLLSNAVKFTERGAISVRVGASPGEAGRVRLTFTVADTGEGMDAETRSRLFKAFEQGDNSVTRRHGGTGLGLAISERLASMMGGALDVESVEGRGSAFTLSLPAALAEAAADHAPHPLEAPEPLDRSLRILVAEDNAANQRIIERFLSPLGADVTLVDDGAKALEALSVAAFDVVLMDMQMPVMGGVEATLRLRAADGPNRDVPVLALTANVMEDQRRACLEAGMNGHVGKPIDPNLLLAAVLGAAGLAEEAPGAQQGAQRTVA